MSNTGFIFDLGTITVDVSSSIAPTFDPRVTGDASNNAMKGDLLLQYRWKRGAVIDVSDNDDYGTYTGINEISGNSQGDWFNCFLFDMSGSDIDDLSGDDIKYHTVKANFCGKSITRSKYDAWQKPRSISRPQDYSNNDPEYGDANNVGAGWDPSSSDTSGAGLIYFDSNTDILSGNYNVPYTSKVYGWDKGVSGDEVIDHSTHLTLAGEYIRYYASRLFGGNLRQGLDIFNNEYELIDEIRKMDVSLNVDIQTILQTSNDLSGTNLKTIDCIPHILLTQLLDDPSGVERVINTLALQTNFDSSGVSGEVPPMTQHVEAGYSRSFPDTVQENLSIGAAWGPLGTNSFYRVPLAANDKLRIKVVINDGRDEPSGMGLAVEPRTYIIEYLLVE